jgi:hypothetical protein
MKRRRLVTAYKRHWSGMPLSMCVPRSSKEIPEPPDEILDGARDEDLAGAGRGGDACAGVNRDSGGPVADDFAFARVEAHPDLELEVAQAVANRVGAANGARRTIEGGEKPVAGRVYLAPSVACDLSTYDAVVSRQEVAPGAVAELRRTCGRAPPTRSVNSTVTRTRSGSAASSALLRKRWILSAISGERKIPHSSSPGIRTSRASGIRLCTLRASLSR